MTILASDEDQGNWISRDVSKNGDYIQKPRQGVNECMAIFRQLRRLPTSWWLG